MAQWTIFTQSDLFSKSTDLFIHWGLCPGWLTIIGNLLLLIVHYFLIISSCVGSIHTMDNWNQVSFLNLWLLKLSVWKLISLDISRTAGSLLFKLIVWYFWWWILEDFSVCGVRGKLKMHFIWGSVLLACHHFYYRLRSKENRVTKKTGTCFFET